MHPSMFNNWLEADKLARGVGCLMWSLFLFGLVFGAVLATIVYRLLL
jgi:hypothetical protein